MKGSFEEEEGEEEEGEEEEGGEEEEEGEEEVAVCVFLAFIVRSWETMRMGMYIRKRD